MSTEPESTNDGDTVPAGTSTSTEEPAAVLERLRQALAETLPGVATTAISGSTLAEVEANYATARAAFDAGRRQARATSAAVVPAGAPGRATALAGTAHDKIRAGLAGLEVTSLA
jgi:hypothetical protein